MIKEVVCAEESKIRIQHNGIVLKEYNENLGWYRFKIIADVAVVTAVVSYDGGYYDGSPVVYGGVTDDDGGTYIWENINEIAGDFIDKAISVVPVDENFRLPEGEIIFSQSSIEDGKFSSWALVLYGGQHPVLYVKYSEFDETSYKEVLSILDKMYILSDD